MQNASKCAAVAFQQNRLFYATPQEIQQLRQIPYELQIQKCLMQGKINEAFLIFDQNAQVGD